MKDVIITPGSTKQLYPNNGTYIFDTGIHEYATGAKSFAMWLGSNVRLVGRPGSVIRVTGDGVFGMGLNAENIIIEGLTIERVGFAGVSNFATALEFRGCRNVEISDCKFIGHGGMCIKLCRDCGFAADGRAFDSLGNAMFGSANVLIRDCEFLSTAGAAIGCKPGGASHVDILRCEVNGFGSYGICIEGDAGGGRRGSVSHVTVADCEITNGDPSRYFGPTNDSIYGIYVGEDAHDIKVRRNKIANLTAKNRRYGISVCTSISQGDRPVSDVEVSQNACDESANRLLVWSGKSKVSGLVVQSQPGMQIDRVNQQSGAK